MDNKVCTGIIPERRETYADHIKVFSNGRGAILDAAKKIINGERQDQYGNPEQSFYTIAQLWNIYIRTRPLPTALTDKDVAVMMVLFKLAREMHGAGKEDNLIDAAGYIGLAADMAAYGREDTN